MNDIIWVILLSIAPVSELRGAIAYGFATDIPFALVVGLSLFFNALVGPVAYFFINFVVHLFLHIQWFERFWTGVVERSQRKLKPSIEKYGTAGMALFIGIPLPGTGVYTGAIGAYALGFSFRRFFFSSVLGVVIAGTIVTAVLVSGEAVLVGLLK